MDCEIFLVALVLVVLAVLFYLVFTYSTRLDQTSYVGEVLGDAFYSRILQRRISELDQAWERHKYHIEAVGDEDWRREHPLPERPTADLDTKYVDLVIRQLERSGNFGTFPPGIGTPTEATRKYLDQLRNWQETDLEKKAKSLRTAEVRRCEIAARAEAQKALRVIDLGTLNGRGPEFILQFTAVVTIVFAVLALGLIGKLESEQAGTILAAIAGYVLGQATARREPGEKTAAPVIPAPDPKPKLKDDDAESP